MLTQAIETGEVEHSSSYRHRVSGGNTADGVYQNHSTKVRIKSKEDKESYVKNYDCGNEKYTKSAHDSYFFFNI